VVQRDLKVEWRDDRRRVTGDAEYSADVAEPDALHAAFLLSSERHARIVSIDTSRAEAMEGVKAIVTGLEIGPRRFGRSLRDYPVLAADRVLYVGQRIAAVAAIDEPTARAAVDLIETEYEPLTPILSLDDAMADEVTVLHPDVMSYDGIDEDHLSGNVMGGATFLLGDDIDEALAECEDEVETTFTFERNHAAPLETHACLVVPNGDEAIVYTAHKQPYEVRRSLAYLTGEPEDRFTVAPIHIGGDFGSKGVPFLEPACWFLARKAGRPVRASMSYYEELTTTASRHPGSARLRTGIKSGRMHAFELEVVLEGGAYAGFKPFGTRVPSFADVGMALYDVPSRDERVVAIYTNTLPTGNVRSPGEFKAFFAGESQIDLVARRLRVDPIEFRLAHVKHPQSTRILRGLQDVVTGWRGELGDDTGIGISIFERSAGRGRTTVLAEATAEGVRLTIPVPDQGSGMYGAFQNLAASTLGVSAKNVTIDAVGADPRLVDMGVGASRVTSIAGGACVDACQGLLSALDAPAEDARPDGYWIADQLRELGTESVVAEGEVSRQGRSSPTFGGLAVQVRVDRGTGKITMERAEILVDGGKPWNEIGFRGQLEGGFVFGLSQTLYESLKIEEGQVVTASLGDYKLACAADIPPLAVTILPTHELDQGSDEIRGGVGEVGNLGVPAAVANAIEDAVGVRVTSLPITAEAVWRLLQAAQV